MNLSPMRYPGGKSKLSPILMQYISPMLEGENAFCDSFIGGGSVLLSVAEKYPDIKLYCNDKDYWVSCFWEIVSSDRVEELLKLVDCKPTIDLFYSLRAEDTKDKLKCAFKCLFFNRTSFSGIIKRTASPIGGKNQSSKWTVDCRYNVKSLQKKIVNINKLLVGRTTVANMDIIDYLETVDCPMYLDPPYVKAGKELYSEYMNEQEHIKLSEALKNKRKWVLSYDDHEIVRDLYKENEIIDLSARYSIRGEKSDWKKKNELIILSK